jgi:hypothetical protein
VMIPCMAMAWRLCWGTNLHVILSLFTFHLASKILITVMLLLLWCLPIAHSHLTSSAITHTPYNDVTEYWLEITILYTKFCCSYAFG